MRARWKTPPMKDKPGRMFRLPYRRVISHGGEIKTRRVRAERQKTTATKKKKPVRQMQLLKGALQISERGSLMQQTDKHSQGAVCKRGCGTDQTGSPSTKMYAGVFFFNQSKMAHSSRVDCNGAVLVHNVFFSSVRSQAAISSKKNYNNVIRLITWYSKNGSFDCPDCRGLCSSGVSPSPSTFSPNTVRTWSVTLSPQRALFFFFH